MATYTKSSLLDEFDLPPVTFDNIKSQLIKVAKTTKVNKKINEKELSLEEKLKLVEVDVFKALGRYRNFVKIIRNINELTSYIEHAKRIEILAFDTETNNSLDPLTAKLMGACFYIPNTRPVYVPINHCEVGTDNLLQNQISEKQLKEVLLSLKDVKIIMHNGKFDLRVIKNSLGFYMPLWWDTMLAAQLIDENEKAALKSQFKNNVDPTSNIYNIEKLFKGVPYTWVNIEIFALYAAIDAYDTYLLYEKQKKFFDKPENQNLLKLFLNIEVPTSLVVAKMEDDGISIDEEFTTKLHNKYTKYLDSCKQKLDVLLIPFQQEIEYYQSIGELDNPINHNSFTQLQIILYDILKYPTLNDEGRTTDETTLKQFNTEFTKTLLDYRHYAKQTSAFTEPLLKFRSKKDGKIHANFHQMGTEEKNVRTGRFSSTKPNLQQIPSDGTVRLMFKGSDEYFKKDLEDEILFKDFNEVITPNGWKYCNDLKIGDIIIIKDNENNTANIVVEYIEKLDHHFIKIKWITINLIDIIKFKIPVRTIYVIIGGDYSQQEPRLLTHMCQDEKLIETYNSGKDLYAFIGSSIFKRDYWECMEVYQDGTPNIEGKHYRKQAKGIVLGIMYGMGAKLLATNLKISIDECNIILNKFFEMFPNVKVFIENNEKSAKEKGFVEDYLGRRRHLPDIKLPELDIKASKNMLIDSVFLEDVPTVLDIPDDELTAQWERLYEDSLKARGKKFEIKNTFKEKAKKSKVEVRDNGAFISKTLTQCTNAKIQGSASSLTKKAMVTIYNDERLNDLETRLLVPVHDELMGEAPKLYASEAIKYFAEDMIKAGVPECSVAMKVDTYVCKNWNLIELYNDIKDNFYVLTTSKNGSKVISKEEAFDKIFKEYEEFSEDTIRQMCYGTYDVINGAL